MVPLVIVGGDEGLVNLCHGEVVVNDLVVLADVHKLEPLDHRVRLRLRYQVDELFLQLAEVALQHLPGFVPVLFVLDELVNLSQDVVGLESHVDQLLCVFVPASEDACRLVESEDLTVFLDPLVAGGQAIDAHVVLGWNVAVGNELYAFDTWVLDDNACSAVWS